MLTAVVNKAKAGMKSARTVVCMLPALAFAQATVVDAGDPAPILGDFATKVGGAFLLVFGIALGLAVIAFVWRRSRALQSGK